MSRTVKEVLKSGYLTPSEQQAIEFEEALEANEETMGGGAALAVTCEQFGFEIDEYADVLSALPDGDWWDTRKLPVKS